MEMGCKSLKCMECCKKYRITLLPEEAKAIAKMLRMRESDFLKKYCVLHLQLFPAQLSKDKLIIHGSALPKKTAKNIDSKLGYLPDFFLALPAIALKKGKTCIFLKKNLCKIHKAKPMQCKLFPFIALEENADLKKMYPFCKSLKEKKISKKSFLKCKKHYKSLSNYFEKVKKEGFLKQWKALPEKGIVVLKGTEIGAISRKEFLAAIQR